MEIDSSSKDNQKKTKKKSNSQTNKGWLYLKTNFKPEMVKRQGHYYYDKGIINPSRRFNKWKILIGAQKKHNIKQILMEIKGETNSNRIIVGDFNTPTQQWVDHPDRESIRKQLI